MWAHLIRIRYGWTVACRFWIVAEFSLALIVEYDAVDWAGDLMESCLQCYFFDDSLELSGGAFRGADWKQSVFFRDLVDFNVVSQVGKCVRVDRLVFRGMSAACPTFSVDHYAFSGVVYVTRPESGKGFSRMIRRNSGLSPLLTCLMFAAFRSFSGVSGVAFRCASMTPAVGERGRLAYEFCFPDSGADDYAEHEVIADGELVERCPEERIEDHIARSSLPALAPLSFPSLLGGSSWRRRRWWRRDRQLRIVLGQLI